MQVDRLGPGARHGRGAGLEMGAGDWTSGSLGRQPGEGPNQASRLGAKHVAAWFSRVFAQKRVEDGAMQACLRDWAYTGLLGCLLLG